MVTPEEKLLNAIYGSRGEIISSDDPSFHPLIVEREPDQFTLWQRKADLEHESDMILISRFQAVVLKAMLEDWLSK